MDLIELAAQGRRFRLKIGRAKDDPEKLITPGVVFSSKSSPTAVAYVIAIGWWDWHISLLFGWGAQTKGEAP